MTLQSEDPRLEKLMRSFYTLSGIRSVLFDTEFRAIAAYPAQDCTFCKLMKSCPATRRKCRYADRRSFLECEKKNALILYKCHAGLVEAVMPLHDNEKIIGYLMFGQITDGDKAVLGERIPDWTERYGLDPAALRRGIGEIPHKSKEQIHAAAQIMEACTCYILYEELVTPENDKVLESARAYIEAHLQEDIGAETLCTELGICRTKLYELFREEFKIGVSGYILRRRMHRAKKLLKGGAMSVPQVAGAVGFADYNYFSRVFKKTYGRSPRSYLK